MQNPDVLNMMNGLGIIGKSPLLMQALNAAVQVAPYDVTVLVTGENGVGKDFFYKILHNGSHRRHKKCIAVNCGGLPEGTIDSELFGHVKGAYTGSVSDRKGYFEEADGGTIFLDEVGDLPMSIQAKLLRVLEKGEIIRMGSNEVRHVDVRIVAATNVDLEKAIREGRFREDLYYRLSTIRIHVPSLRDRREDIYLLFRKFASDTASKYKMTQGIQLTEDARQKLLAYSWPGNVRQLLHIVEEMSIIEMDRVITPDILQKYLPKFDTGVSVGGGSNGKDSNDFLPGEKALLYNMILTMKNEIEEIKTHLGLTPHTNPPHKQLAIPSSVVKPEVQDYQDEIQDAQEVQEMPEDEKAWVYNPPTIDKVTVIPTAPAPEQKPQTMAEIEKEAITNALKRNGGNKRKAAEELAMSERTIHRKIQEYGIANS